jgi:hypothetical protein
MATILYGLFDPPPHRNNNNNNILGLSRRVFFSDNSPPRSQSGREKKKGNVPYKPRDPSFVMSFTGVGNQGKSVKDITREIIDITLVAYSVVIGKFSE